MRRNAKICFVEVISIQTCSQFLPSVTSGSTSTLTWPWGLRTHVTAVVRASVLRGSMSDRERAAISVTWCLADLGSCTDCQQCGLLQLGSRWSLHYCIPKISDGGDRSSWKSTWRHFSAGCSPIWMKVGRLVQNDMPIAVIWTKSNGSRIPIWQTFVFSKRK